MSKNGSSKCSHAPGLVFLAFDRILAPYFGVCCSDCSESKRITLAWADNSRGGGKVDLRLSEWIVELVVVY